MVLRPLPILVLVLVPVLIRGQGEVPEKAVVGDEAMVVMYVVETTEQNLAVLGHKIKAKLNARGTVRGWMDDALKAST